jgi:hypothetical protein
MKCFLQVVSTMKYLLQVVFTLKFLPRVVSTIKCLLQVVSTMKYFLQVVSIMKCLIRCLHWNAYFGVYNEVPTLGCVYNFCSIRLLSYDRGGCRNAWKFHVKHQSVLLHLIETGMRGQKLIKFASAESSQNLFCLSSSLMRTNNWEGRAGEYNRHWL